MKIVKLTDLFYQENRHLIEALDKKGSDWDRYTGIATKERGYGMALLPISNLEFGIPLRKNISHKFCFITKECRGLDYSKAVLIQKPDYISPDPFIIPQDEFLTIEGREKHIIESFEKYVELYIEAVSKNDPNRLKKYNFSTLQNYRKELQIIL
jgi:protein AbiQ